MPEKLRIGLIGAGRIGRMHAEHIAFRVPEAELAIVADVHRTSAEACAKACGVSAVTDDYRMLLERPEVDAVAICSPSPTHMEIIEAAARAGKHIFCEKPLDLDLHRIDRAVAAVESGGVLLQVGFNRRFDPSFQRLREAVLEGEIGEPHLLHLVSRDPIPPPIEFLRFSGGLFLDMTIHDFDMACFLLGPAIESVYATARVLVDPAIGEAGDVDTAVVVLHYASGAIGTIDNSRRATYGYDQRAEIFGSKGSIRMHNAYPNTAWISSADNVRRDPPHHFFLERYREAYVQELRAFASAVLEDGPSPMSGREARMPVVIGLAAQRSSKENRPVRLDEVDGSRRQNCS